MQLADFSKIMACTVKQYDGTEKPAKKGKNREMFSSGLVLPGERDGGLHDEYYGEELAKKFLCSGSTFALYLDWITQD